MLVTASVDSAEVGRRRQNEDMASRGIAHLRSCGLQLRTIAQNTRRAGFASGASTDEGIRTSLHLEQRLENPVLLSGNSATHGIEDAVQYESSEDTEFEDSIKIGAPHLRFIREQRRKRQNIERSTNTHIIFPRSRELKSALSLVVKGASKQSVETALAEIRAWLQRAERSPNLQHSHFISLPLVSHQALLEHLRRFREAFLTEEQKANDYVSWFPENAEKENSIVSRVIATNKVTKINSSHILDPDLEALFSDEESSDDENERFGSKSHKVRNSLFLKPETAHITVLMLKLFTDDRINVAAEVLQGVKSKVLEILDGQVPKVILKGIECLRGSPAEAQVLSINVQESDNGNRLQQACQAIKDAYNEAGLVAEPDKKQELKLHVTLMNTSFLRRLESNAFDARKILEKYRSHEWGEYSVNEVHLSQRFFYDESGYYHCCGSFQGPSVVSQSSAKVG